MREIKFRGRCIKSGDLVIGDLIHGIAHKTGRMYILPSIHNLAYVKHCDPLDGVEVDKETVGQFTGLKDKNGNDIYEGDEVEYEWNDSWSGEWVSKGGAVEYNNGEFFPLPNNDAVREYVVTGNIYQNPQLIETQNA